jgi:hypothetical protein
MKLAFAMLAHGSPALATRLIRLLRSQGHYVAVHYDAKASQSDFNTLTATFSADTGVRFAHRERVGWGQWGVTQGALNCLDEIEKAGWNPSYVYHISGMDYPIRSSAQLIAFLKRNNGDEFIESVPANRVTWVKTGPQRERYEYRWWFNWRSRPNLTESFFYLQKRFGLKRRFVRDMEPYIGSQWWVLTWKTLKKIRAVAQDPDVIAFFKSTLVPDELFFQTLIRYGAPEAHVTNCPLTLYQFTDYGYPVVYYSDHIEYLTNQQMFFARKFSSNDKTIRDLLDLYWRGALTNGPVNDGRVGIVGPEYETRRRAYRYGVPGAPLIGSLNSGALKIETPTFAIVGSSDYELNLVKDALEDTPGVVFHGQIFHASRIDLVGDNPDFAGYNREDVIIRDSNRQKFLEDVIRASKGRTTAFLIRVRPADPLPDVLFDLADLQVFFLEGNPVIAFLENDGAGTSTSIAPSPTLQESPASADHSELDGSDFTDAFEREFQALKTRVRDVVSDRLDRSVVSVVLSGDGQDWCEALATHLGLDRAHSASLFDKLKKDIGSRFPSAAAPLDGGLHDALEAGGLKFKSKSPAPIDEPMV